MTGVPDFRLERAHATILAFPARTKAATIRRYTLFRLITMWVERARQRQALADLDDRLLRDIGMTRGQAMGEFSKPFWR